MVARSACVRKGRLTADHFKEGVIFHLFTYSVLKYDLKYNYLRLKRFQLPSVIMEYIVLKSLNAKKNDDTRLF